MKKLYVVFANSSSYSSNIYLNKGATETFVNLGTIPRSSTFSLFLFAESIEPEPEKNKNLYAICKNKIQIYSEHCFFFNSSS